MKKPTLKIRIIIYLSILAILAVCCYAMTYMPGNSYAKDFPDLTKPQIALANKYKEQLENFSVKPHNSQNLVELKKVEDYLENQLKDNGFKNIFIQKYLDMEAKNFEVTIEPKAEVKNTVVIGAHYDSADISPGADDNGSAVVILLELAKRFKEKFDSQHTRIRIVLFANEEPPFFGVGLMGSKVYAKYLIEKKENIRAMYALDALGYYREEEGTQHYPYMFAPFYPSKGNFVAFVGNLHSRSLVVDTVSSFRKNAKFPSEGISALGNIPGISYSDHRSFYEYGIPALMITDTAFNRNPHYHTAQDTIDKLDLGKMAQLTDELEKMFRDLYEK